MRLSRLQRRLGSRTLTFIGCVWLAVVCLGLKRVLDHQSRAGVSAKAPARWPAACGLARTPGRPTLLILSHPKCPCTRATISELAALMARPHGALVAVVVFVVPQGMAPRQARSALWREASAIPGVRVLLDSTGAMARSFGAFTSGQALYYDANGSLCFAGGITAGRGHAGANAGRDAVLALAVSARPSLVARTPVFGCELWSPADFLAHQGESCPH